MKIAFIISRLVFFFFSPSCLLLYAPHCFWADLSGQKKDLNELFKEQEKFQLILFFFYKYVTLIFIYFIFGCAGSLLLQEDFL